MNGWMQNSKRYETFLKNMPKPVQPSQLSKVKMDLAGLSRYAKKKGVSLSQLTEEEKRRYLPK